jgi:hypothetical protein
MCADLREVGESNQKRGGKEINMKKLIIALLISLVLAVTPAAAGSAVYLVVMSTTNTGNAKFHFFYHEVENLETCQNLIKSSKLAIPHGGDAEAAVVLYCAPSKVKVWEYEEMSE